MIFFLGGRKNGAGTFRTGLGNGFRGLLNYLIDGEDPEKPEPRAAHVGYINLMARTPEKAAYEMRVVAQGLPSCETPVYHFGIALEPADPERDLPREELSVEQWQAVVETFLVRLGLRGHQAVWVLHNDKDHQHVHVAANRVGINRNGELYEWKPYFDVKKGIQVCRELELELGLRLTAAQAPRSEYQPSPHALRREADEPLALVIREQILPDLEDLESWKDLEDRLASHGIALELGRQGRGLVFRQGEGKKARRISASKVHRNLSMNRLSGRFTQSFEEHRKAHRPPPLAEPTQPDQPREVGLRHLLRSQSTFSEKDLDRLLEGHPEAETLKKGLLARAIPVGLRPEIPEPAGPPPPDGQPKAAPSPPRPLWHDRIRYTSREVFERERLLFEGAKDLASRRLHALDPQQVQTLVRELYPWAAREQVAAIHAATSGSDLVSIVGRPGTGKTHPVSAAIAAAYLAADIPVLGLALSAKAADGLETAAGVTSITFARLRILLETGRPLAPGTVLLVDEAGMLNTRQLGVLIEHALEQQLKLVLVGDPDQLTPIGPGDPFRALTTLHESVELAGIRRQKKAWMREASQALVRGDVAAALGAYERHDSVHEHANALAARTAVLQDYLAEGKPQTSLLLAATNLEVDLLNYEIRKALMASGQLPDLPYQRLVVGDRVLLTKNALAEGYRNGSLGTVVRIGKTKAKIRLDTGGEVDAPYADITHGYALTVHRAQGVTADSVYYYAGYADRHLALVAMTRHRHDLRVYWDRETFQTYGDLLLTLRQPSRNDLVLDYQSALEVATRPIEPSPSSLSGEEQYRRSRPAAVGLEEHLRITNRGLDPIPGLPEPRRIDPWVERFADLRELQEQRLAKPRPSSALWHWRAYEVDRRIHETLDDLWHLAGAERLPPTLSVRNLPAWAKATEAMHESGSYKERYQHLVARAELAFPRKPLAGDVELAKETMKELAFGTWSMELPDFRRAAAVVWGQGHPGDPTRKLIERYSSDPSETSAEALLRHLSEDSFPWTFESRLETLESEGLPAVPLMHLGFEMKLALRSAIRRHQHRAAELEAQLLAEPGARDRLPATARSRQPVDVGALRASLGAVRELRQVYGRVRHAQARSEMALLHEALADPELRVPYHRQQLEEALARSAAVAAYTVPRPLTMEAVDHPQYPFERLSAQLRELEASPPADASPTEQIDYQLELTRVRETRSALWTLMEAPPQLPQRSWDDYGRPVLGEPLAQHLSRLDERALLLDRFLPERTDAHVLRHLARGDFAFLDDLLERGRKAPEPLDLDPPEDPIAAFDRYVETARSLQLVASRSASLEDPELQAAARALREARGQAVAAQLPMPKVGEPSIDAHSLSLDFRTEAAGGPPETTRNLALYASSHRRGGLYRLARWTERRLVRSMGRRLVKVAAPTVQSVAARTVQRLID